MPRVREGLARVRRAKRPVRHALVGGRVQDKWHWFDHPEMQSRIAEAEADRREGRVTRMDTPEAMDAYLDSLV